MSDGLSTVARLHAENIDQGFLPVLGLNFLTLLSQTIDEDPESALIPAYTDGRICGFIAGSLNLKSVYRGLLHRRPAQSLHLSGGAGRRRAAVAFFFSILTF